MDSFSKFKNDMLSKVLYDAFKYLVGIFTVVYLLKYMPVAKQKLGTQLHLSTWSLLLFALTLIFLSFALATYLVGKKFKKLKLESQLDEMTGLKNHKALNDDLVKLVDARRPTDEPISLILIDIDDFKKFNEQHSYEIADKILKKLGELLNKDSRITDEVYRYFQRGDEFLIVAKQTNLSNARIASERKRRLIQNSIFTIDGTSFKLTVSCGVTELNYGESGDVVTERVNKALQAAKKNPGKNSTEIMV